MTDLERAFRYGLYGVMVTNYPRYIVSADMSWDRPVSRCIGMTTLEEARWAKRNGYSKAWRLRMHKSEPYMATPGIGGRRKRKQRRKGTM